MEGSQPCRLKYCTAFSCFSAAARVPNVPRFFLLPVFGSFLREYKRYSPDLSFLIISRLHSGLISSKSITLTLRGELGYAQLFARTQTALKRAERRRLLHLF